MSTVEENKCVHAPEIPDKLLHEVEDDFWEIMALPNRRIVEILVDYWQALRTVRSQLARERESRKQAEAALQKIVDHDFSCECDDHSSPDCCANCDPSDYLCAGCIAGQYFGASKPIPQEPARD